MLYNDDINSSNTKNIILVIGACCLDRILHVTTYPKEDTKCRTVSSLSSDKSRLPTEYCGGNATNVAITLSKLLVASPLTCIPKVFQKREQQYQVRLCSKIGNDSVGQQIVQELKQMNTMDIIQHPLFHIVENKTTNIVHVIVTQDTNTRTCIFTPGTCGELDEQDLMSDDHATATIKRMLLNVVHIHTDGRHTEFAYHLIRLAKQINPSITISIDHERNRESRFYPLLLQQSDIVFMNGYDKFNELQQSSGTATSTTIGATATTTDKTASLQQEDFHNKHYIIMLGEHGAVSILPQQHTERDVYNNQGSIREQGPARTTRRHSGVLLLDDPNRMIINTTGAGDAFIGSYLGYYLLIKDNENRDDIESFLYSLCLQFACWMSGHKIRGNGTSNLPSGSMIDQLLGTNNIDIYESLCEQLTNVNSKHR